MKGALQEMRERADKSWATLEKRVADFELELRARLENLSTETEAARLPLPVRTQEVPRRLDDPSDDPNAHE
jgi:CRP-like cAMP-binding protein